MENDKVYEILNKNGWKYFYSFYYFIHPEYGGMMQDNAYQVYLYFQS